MVDRRDLRALSAIAAIPASFMLFLWASGRTVFWGDLTYIHHPWRALSAEYLQRGMLPLWNPYVYLGMPLAAEMQCAAWYPGTLPFYLFSFVGGLRVFHGAHFALAGFFCFLWLRKEGLTRGASTAGAVVFMGGGMLVSRVPFLNHLSSLAFVPAFLLLRSSPFALALALALCFLSGYPAILAGGAAVAFLLPWIAGRRAGSSGLRDARAWAAAGALSVGLSACLLIPALQLTLDTRRGGGLGLEETLSFAFAWRDLRQWIGPLALARGDFSPALLWWKTSYIGAAATVLAFLALAALRRRAAAGLAVLLAVVWVLVLGGDNRASLFLWTALPPLRYIRYPGNLAFLAAPALALLVAVALHRRRWAWTAVLAVAAELSLYAATSHPLVPDGYFTDAGPLVRQLQSDLQGHRYLLSPRSLQWHRGAGENAAAAALDLKHRLYGLTNAPYHLRSVGNFGEPLVPKASYQFMDDIFSTTFPKDLLHLAASADVRVVMTREQNPKMFPDDDYDLREGGLWLQYWMKPYKKADIPARALWSQGLWATSESEKSPEVQSGEYPDDSAPVAFEQNREDRYVVRGKDEGYLAVSEPSDDGWRFWLNVSPIWTERSLAYTTTAVPSGDWEFRAVYLPGSWTAGLSTTLLFLIAVSAYWYNRTRKIHEHA
ncbi:MAG: hypothetical protein HY078_08070 [Elusimicrobia bacterium]|nr:hypothetical protein [Elusimicrobiota bacterium]